MSMLDLQGLTADENGGCGGGGGGCGAGSNLSAALCVGCPSTLSVALC